MESTLTELDLKPFQFITRVDPSEPLISRGTLGYCVKRMTTKLKTMELKTEQDILNYRKIKVIRDELRDLKNSL